MRCVNESTATRVAYEACSVLQFTYVCIFRDRVVKFGSVFREATNRSVFLIYLFVSPSGQGCETLRKENFVEQQSAVEYEQTKVHRHVPRALRGMRYQKSSRRATVSLARRRRGGRQARAVRSVDKGVVGARQADRFKVSDREKRSHVLYLNLYCRRRNCFKRVEFESNVKLNSNTNSDGNVQRAPLG